ncbi:MAG: L,D-transpeptidase family protein [Marinilabiliales bacterium]|nr:L,D-transpeptidase family protein [Marinilabiliales bacterium]
MRYLFYILPLWFVVVSLTDPDSYRERQLRNTRVREAYASKEKSVVKTLSDHGLSRDSFRICFRVYKREKKMELWAKNLRDSSFQLLKEFTICDISGDVGPKRRSRDLQVPEGFYHLDGMNPYSKYYLSMKINYPNASDSIRGVKRHLGSQIFIHGACISSGCLAMTNERIMELYLYCTEAYNCGQEAIEITIFPCRMDDATYSELIHDYRSYKDCISLWADLKKSWDLFEKYKIPPAIQYLPDGTHGVTKGCW